MKLFTTTADLTEIAKLIISENITSLEEKISQGFDINRTFNITDQVAETPITLALCEKKKKVIDWLLSKHVDLNNHDSPAILTAYSNNDITIIKQLIENGANVNAKGRTGATGINYALWANRPDVIPILIENGYAIKKDGTSLRQAVFNRQKKAISLLLEHGADVNFNEPDMVFPYNPTAVHIAAENNDIETVKLLIAHAADITIKNLYGERPYNAAVANDNAEMKMLIQSLEPERWHNQEQKVYDLQAYRVPEQLLAILCSDNRKMELTANENVKYIEFSSILDTREVHWMEHTFLDLLSKVDNYSAGGFLVWCTEQNCLASADYEHQEFKLLCSVEDFLQDPSKQIDKLFQ